MRPMEFAMLEQHLKNIDLRLIRVEQILPTLANKDDLVELRRYMDVLTESLRGDIHLIAAHVASAQSKGNET
jgi:hypothetical protein